MTVVDESRSTADCGAAADKRQRMHTTQSDTRKQSDTSQSSASTSSANSSTSTYSSLSTHGHSMTTADDVIDDKPELSYASLIGRALLALPDNRARLNAIYQWIATNFPYYHAERTGWQNSIRHNLTVNKCFVKDPRDSDPPGKGSFWKIDPDHVKFFETGVFEKPTSAHGGDSAPTVTGEISDRRRKKESAAVTTSSPAPAKRPRKRSRTSRSDLTTASTAIPLSAPSGHPVSAQQPQLPKFFSVFKNSSPPGSPFCFDPATVYADHTRNNCSDNNNGNISNRPDTPLSAYQQHPSLIASTATSPSESRGSFVHGRAAQTTTDLEEAEYHLAAANLCHFAAQQTSALTASCPTHVYLLTQKMRVADMLADADDSNNIVLHHTDGDVADISGSTSSSITHVNYYTGHTGDDDGDDSCHSVRDDCYGDEGDDLLLFGGSAAVFTGGDP